MTFPSGTMSEEAATIWEGSTAKESGEAFYRPQSVFAVRFRPAEWLAECRRCLERMLGIGPNWDSYGAAAVDPASIDVAARLSTFLAQVETVAAPVVSATPDGNVALCWDDGDVSIDLEAHANGTIGFVYLRRSDPSEDREGATSDWWFIAHLLTRW